MRVGFSGTRHGMTDEQRRAFIAWAKTAGVTEFHHGCCIGADSQAVEVMMPPCDMGIESPRIVAHPPVAQPLFSASAHLASDERRCPYPYLVRNRNIVDASEHLVACPKGPEELRSGTWSTVRFARKVGKPVTIIWPDGTIE